MRFPYLVFPILFTIAQTGAAEESTSSLRALKRISLLTNPQVQQELKLTDEQKTKVEEGRRELFAGLSKLDQNDRDTQSSKLQKEYGKLLSELLSEEQLQRLDQIALQEIGLYVAIGSEELLDELDVSDEQKTKLRGVGEEVAGQMRTLLREPFSQERSRKMRAVGQKADAAVLEFMTASQKRTWQKLTGEPFRPMPIAPKVID